MVGTHREDGRRGKRREEEEVGWPVTESVAGDWTGLARGGSW